MPKSLLSIKSLARMEIKFSQLVMSSLGMGLESLSTVMRRPASVLWNLRILKIRVSSSTRATRWDRPTMINLETSLPVMRSVELILVESFWVHSQKFTPHLVGPTRTKPTFCFWFMTMNSEQESVNFQIHTIWRPKSGHRRILKADSSSLNTCWKTKTQRIQYWQLSPRWLATRTTSSYRHTKTTLRRKVTSWSRSFCTLCRCTRVSMPWTRRMNSMLNTPKLTARWLIWPTKPKLWTKAVEMDRCWESSMDTRWKKMPHSPTKLRMKSRSLVLSTRTSTVSHGLRKWPTKS